MANLVRNPPYVEGQERFRGLSGSGSFPIGSLKNRNSKIFISWNSKTLNWLLWRDCGRNEAASRSTAISNGNGEPLFGLVSPILGLTEMSDP
jgi:hypothetical protein